jgi:hypothetical protein
MKPGIGTNDSATEPNGGFDLNTFLVADKCEEDSEAEGLTLLYSGFTNCLLVS